MVRYSDETKRKQPRTNEDTTHTIMNPKCYNIYGRLIRQVATEAMKFGRGSWLRKMSMCCKEFGWKDVSMEGVRGLSNAEVKDMLESIA